VLAFFALGHFTAAAVFVVAAAAVAAFWLIEQNTAITPPMAVGGFVVAAVATIPWAYAALLLLFATGQISFERGARSRLAGWTPTSWPSPVPRARLI
jgi:hypothetical protein